MVGDFGWEHEGTKSRVGTVKLWIKNFMIFTMIIRGEVMLFKIGAFLKKRKSSMWN